MLENIVKYGDQCFVLPHKLLAQVIEALIQVCINMLKTPKILNLFDLPDLERPEVQGRYGNIFHGVVSSCICIAGVLLWERLRVEASNENEVNFSKHLQ